jgi:hypothetical protein
VSKIWQLVLGVGLLVGLGVAFSFLSHVYGGTIATVVVIAIFLAVCLLWLRHGPPPPGPTRDSDP